MATLFLLLLSLNPSWAQNLTGETEFQQKKEFMNARFEDFFAHQEQLQRAAEKREKSAGEVGPVRTAEEKLKEKERLEYVRTRPQAEDREAARIAHEKDQAKIAKQMDEYRKNYVLREDTLQKLFEHSRKVPADYDSGLKEDSN